MRESHYASVSLRSVAASACLLTLLSPTSLIARASTPEERDLAFETARQSVLFHENYDYRDELIAERAGKQQVSPARTAATARLAERLKGFTLHLDEVSGLPKMVATVAPGERLSGKGVRQPEVAARNFLAANAEAFGVTPRDLATLENAVVSSPEGGATIVRLEQNIAGIPVFRGDFSVVMTPRENAVVGTTGTIFPNLAGAATSRTFAVSMLDAVARASKDLAPSRSFVAGDFDVSGLDDAGYSRLRYRPDSSAVVVNPQFGEGLRARQVIFPIAAGEAIPAYYVEVNLTGELAGAGPYYSYVVSAVDGRVLFRMNLTADETFQYRVFADTAAPFRPFDSPEGITGTPHPTGLPDNFQAAGVTTNDVAVESLIGPTDPWLPAGAIETTGNNVDAYLDVAGADGFTAGDIRGAITAAGQFLPDWSHTNSSQDATVRQSKAVHMFFYNNWLHDIWYPRGFDEVWRNAQTDNYGRGGSAGDNIRGEGEDRTGTNNANMSTPADGGRPRMQMYRFNNPEPDRDSSTDFGIVAHEWMHFMSNRLVGNATGLSNNQGRSMGEGWGDWNALVNIVRVGDNLDGAFTTGAWATLSLWPSYTNNYYYGIRRYPYSTRMDIFPMTFAFIGPNQTFPPAVPRNANVNGSPSEVHNAGEVWCNMLWEMTASLMKTYGIEEGRTRALQYVCDGMKAAAQSGPTFGQERDGILTAANAVHPEDVPLVWQAFAKRGIGEGAVSPVPTSPNHSGITESFVAPVALPNDTIAVSSAGSHFQRNLLLGGAADLQFSFGSASMSPLAGNWNGGTGVGADRASTIGAYDASSGFFFLRNTNTPGAADVVFGFGAGGSAVAITGDWNGDGVDTVGIYDPATGAFFLRNTNSAGPADVVFSFGPGGVGFVPVVGDWNGDGTDTVGVYDPATGAFFLRNSNSNGGADLVFTFGVGGAIQPVAGDWNDDGTDTIGIYAPASGVTFLRNSNTSGPADVSYTFGPGGGAVACVGDFDGQ
ncbi:MAG: M36 family metallopeptidase [Blastocatellia bacterium]|nr:M36 family metallopeptidase [Blastocatellia bacterium]